MDDDRDKNWREHVDAVDRALGKLRERVSPLLPQRVRVGLRQVVGTLERRYDRDAPAGVSTGLSSVDDLTHGLRPGEVSVLAGRPWMGTTSLALGWAQSAAEHGVPVLIFSPDLSIAALAERMLCARSRVDGVLMRAGRLETSHWVQITRATSELADFPIQVEDHPAPAIDAICDAVRRWRDDGEQLETTPTPWIVVIDAVRLVRGVLRDPPDWFEAGLRLREVAAATRTHIVLVASLSSAIDQRVEHRPILQDLRPRGLDRAASSIGFLYRDEVYSKERCRKEDRGIAELIFAKNDAGPTGMVRLRFLNQYTRFEDAPDA